jgi:hypothetical protein
MGSEGVEIKNVGVTIVIDRAGGVGSVWSVASTTCGEKLNVPVWVAVPDITPVELLRPRPGGSSPLKLQKNGAVPPES